MGQISKSPPENEPSLRVVCRISLGVLLIYAQQIIKKLNRWDKWSWQ